MAVCFFEGGEKKMKRPTGHAPPGSCAWRGGFYRIFFGCADLNDPQHNLSHSVGVITPRMRCVDLNDDMDVKWN